MVIYLQILLAMEYDDLGLNFAILDVYLVAAQHNRDILADAHQITMPIWYVLVGDTRCHVEHDNGALSLNVVSISQTTEFLLASCVPHVESNGTSVSVEDQRMYLNAKCCNILLFEFAGHVTFDECGFAGSAVAD